MSLQAKNFRVVAMGHDPLVVLITEDVRPAIDPEVRADQGLDIPPRTWLVSQGVHDDPDEWGADKIIERIGRCRRDSTELFGEAQRAAIVALSEATNIQRPHRSQKVL